MVIKAQNFQPDGAQQLKICLHLKIISLFLNPPSLSHALSLALSLTHTHSLLVSIRERLIAGDLVQLGDQLLLDSL